MATAVYRRSFLERFWSRVDRSGTADGCWPWMGARTRDGYGRIRNHGENVYAHHAAWELTHGAIKDSLWVLHRCDNPPCCNPTHLFLGTARDNALDRQAKGRGSLNAGQPLPWRSRPPRGSKNYQAKLTEQAVRELIARWRAGGVTQKQLATEYGIDPSIVSEVIAGKRWAHVGEAER